MPTTKTQSIPVPVPDPPPLPPKPLTPGAHYRGHAFRSIALPQGPWYLCHVHNVNKRKNLLEATKHKFEPKKIKQPSLFESSKPLNSEGAVARLSVAMDKKTAEAQISMVCEQFFKKDSPQRRSVFDKAIQNLPEAIAFVSNTSISNTLFEDFSEIMCEVFYHKGINPAVYQKIRQILFGDAPHNKQTYHLAADKLKALRENIEWLLGRVKQYFGAELIRLIASHFGIVNIASFCREDYAESIMTQKGICLGMSLNYLCDTKPQERSNLFRTATELHARYKIAYGLSKKLKKLVNQLVAHSTPLFSSKENIPKLQMIASQHYKQYQYRLALNTAMKQGKLEVIKTYVDHKNDEVVIKVSNPILQRKAMVKFLLQHCYATPQYSRILETIIHVEQLPVTDSRFRQKIIAKLQREVAAIHNRSISDYLAIYGLSLGKMQKINLDELIVKMTKKNSRYLIRLLNPIPQENTSNHAVALKVDNNEMISLIDPNLAIFEDNRAEPLAYLFQYIATTLYPSLTVWMCAPLQQKTIRKNLC